MPTAASSVIAGPMAEPVVDLLETVEVEIEHRDGVFRGGLRDQPLRVLEECRPVGELGQRVAIGEPVRLRARALVLDGDGAERHAGVDDDAAPASRAPSRSR